MVKRRRSRKVNAYNPQSAQFRQKSRYRPSKRSILKRQLLALLTLIVIVIALIGLIVNIKPETVISSKLNARPQVLKNQSKSSLVVDFQTGQIIAENNINAKFANASTSKLLTAYLVNKAVKEGKLSWNQGISPDEAVSELSQNTDYVNVPLMVGEKYTVKDLLSASINLSANAATILLGNAVSGNPADFAELMNKTAKSFGIPKGQYHFINAAGMQNGVLGSAKITNAPDDDENEISAEGIATITYRLFHDYPNVIDVLNQGDVIFGDIKQDSYTRRINSYLDSINSNYDLIGAKTGSSQKAGSVITGLFENKKNQTKYISVVMNGSDYTDPFTTWQTASTDIDSATKKMKDIKLTAGQVALGASYVNVLQTTANKINLVANDSINYWSRNKGEISFNPIENNWTLTSVNKKSVFKTKANNLTNAEFLYSTKNKDNVILVPEESSTTEMNPLIKFWRWIVY
ncbi:MAG: serine hydrolase [Lactobacillaceae bacterium]|jgi:D-alanyl-D-alanine carboxypeptidase (penicillin-binding protein 5/6)|nr:serine hydrolase [Lactobacillaceae bacterium]